MQRGGRYEIGKNGKVKLIETPTKDHPVGKAPRDPDGRRMDRPDMDRTDPAASGQKG